MNKKAFTIFALLIAVQTISAESVYLSCAMLPDNGYGPITAFIKLDEAMNKVSYSTDNKLDPGYITEAIFESNNISFKSITPISYDVTINRETLEISSHELYRTLNGNCVKLSMSKNKI
jgi:hypothetical protein